MRTSVVIVFALFCALSFALDIRSFLPCSFDVHLTTNAYVETDPETKFPFISSSDRLMRDGEADYWMWKSNHGGADQIIDEDEWTIVWRPDQGEKGTSYHMNKSGCVKNEGFRKFMSPRPYDWLLERVDGNNINWLLDRGSYEGVATDILRADFTIHDVDHATPQFSHIPVSVEVVLLRDSGSLVSISGSAKAVVARFGPNPVPITFNMAVDFFEHNTEIRPTWFVPSASCTGGATLPVPPKSSEGFVKKCYTPESSSSAGSRAIASLAGILLLLIFALFF